MASVLMMAGGAILNTAAFTGGNYLARYLSGDSGKAALAEKRGTTKLSKIIRPHKPNTCATEPSFWIGSKLTEKSKAHQALPIEGTTKSYHNYLWTTFVQICCYPSMEYAA